MLYFDSQARKGWLNSVTQLVWGVCVCICTEPADDVFVCQRGCG